MLQVMASPFRHPLLLLHVTLLALVLCLMSQSAFADNKTAARASASAGIQDYEAGRYAEALKRLQKAEQLLHAPPHLLYLARAQIKLGQLVEARESYLSLIHETLPSNAPPAFFDAQKAARPELADLEPRIPRITVTVAGDEDADLILNGVNMGSGLTGVPYPVDPGKHTVRVATPSAQSAEQAFIVREGEEMPLSLTLLPKSDDTSETEAKPQQERKPEARGDSDPEGTPAKKSALKPALTFGGFGLAAAGVGLGSVTGILAIQKVNSVKKEYECNASGVCNSATEAEANAALKPARTMELLSTVGFAAGALGIGLGIWGLVIDGNEPPKSGKRNGQFVPLIGETNGVSWVGAF